MRRLSVAASALAVVAGALTPFAHASAPTPGSFTEQTYPATGTTPARSYWIYVPSTSNGPMPLVVFLHGCVETAQQTAEASHFNTLAEQRGFVVVYPEQVNSAPSSAPLTDGNGIGCWNWFLPDDQQREQGEPGAIAGITRYVMQTQSVDPNRVYVEGVSAGADMSVILGATYPDLYAAVGVLAGCAYRTCSDSTGALSYQAMGANARVVPMFVENGTADAANNIALATGLVHSWLGADDFADDGQPDGSIPRTPASVQNYGFDQTPQPGTGDLCIHNDSFTCPGGLLYGPGQSYPYTVAKYNDSHNCDVLDFWVIHGMAHAHPDAPGDGPYTDPLGPDVTAASYDFFAAHPKGGGCS